MELDNRTRVILAGVCLLLMVAIVAWLILRGRRGGRGVPVTAWPENDGGERPGDGATAIPIPIGSRPWQGGGA